MFGIVRKWLKSLSPTKKKSETSNGTEMTITELIEKHEGFVSHAYQDSLGYWTIGIGRLVDEKKGGGISREEARYLLNNDIKEVERGLDEKIPWWRHLSQVRRMALIDMGINLGVSGLMGFKNMLSYLEKGLYDKAAKEALNSRWAEQVGQRSKDIEYMIRNDEFPV